MEKLHIANIRMSRLSHPHLQKLKQFESTGTFSHTGLFDLPMLTDWSLFGDDDLYTTRTSLLYQPPPRLRALSISVSPSQVALLSDLPVIQQLHTLVLEVNELEALSVLRDRAASFGHLRSIALPYLLRADDVPAARELRSDLERAFPNTKLEIEWQRIFGEGDFAPLAAVPDVPPVIVDAQSRMPDGRIDAMGAWYQNGPDDE